MGQIIAVGSTALQPLASTAASQFENLHPQVQIKVNGGDSTVGLDAVTTQQADIGDSDIYADRALYPDPNLTDHIVCIIPNAMIVNPNVPISSLGQQQIIDIFSTGLIRNWSQVGGPDLPIVIVAQGSASGTRDTFRKYILGGRDETGNLVRTNSSVNERDTVAQTPGAIGYLALSVLTPQVKTIAINNQMPTQASIAAGNYAFWSYEHMYTLGNTNSTLAAFLDFMLTPAIQQQAQKMNYLPSSVMMQGPIARTSTQHIVSPQEGKVPYAVL
jgi:phosphate transport system substrate-binding protein